MSDLESLIRDLRGRGMTVKERRDQAISFAYGQAKMKNPLITKEEVAHLYDLLVDTFGEPDLPFLIKPV